MEEIRCRECEYMKIDKKYHIGLCLSCVCVHPMVLNGYCPDENIDWKKRLGCIGFTEQDSCTPKIKTCPRWCPKKSEGR